jgi:hypothetical protein
MSESKNKQADALEDRPRCALGGMIRRGVMCGDVIVGGEFCGRQGCCEHKVVGVLHDEYPDAKSKEAA